ncbi:MAG: hypothetical protein WCD35_11875 [Mycobacteriales bacterium]
MRRPLALGALLSVLPVGLAVVAVRPAAAEGPAWDDVGVTALVSGVRTDGVVGASGGLVTLDSGSAYVAARLDASPSAAVLAAPYEPGTLARTGAGQVNAAAGQTVLDVPDADARYPGAQTTSSFSAADPLVAGPLSFGAASARAETGPAVASGTASAASYAVAGVLSAGPSTSTVTMTASADAGTVGQTARTAVSRIEVAGVLVLDDVVATATVTASGDRHTATQALTVGGASVGGQAVAIGNAGVTAVGTPVLPGQTLEQATAQVNDQLAAAGVTVHTVGGHARHDRRSADADTGGVAITLDTPALPGGVAPNRLLVVVGGIALTETDAPAVPGLALGVDVPPPAGGVPATTTTVTVLPGSPAGQAIPGAQPPPQLAAPQAVPAGFVVSGRRISAQTALLAFAAWQVLSMATATLYAFVERRRRLLVAGP